MSDEKLTDLPVLSDAVDDDKMYVVDVSDTTDDAAGTSKQISIADLQTSLDVGHFIINSTGDVSVTGLGFQPTRVKFEATLPIESTDQETAGTGDDERNSAGFMIGYAKDTGSGTEQQASSTAISGNSTDDIRKYSSSSLCIAATYCSSSGSEEGQVDATLKSWDSDGFTINVSTYSGLGNVTGVLVYWTSWR